MTPQTAVTAAQYIDDPLHSGDPRYFIPVWDPRYSQVQNFINDVKMYHNIDQAAITQFNSKWQAWAIGWLRLNEIVHTAADIGNYRQAPQPDKAHVITLSPAYLTVVSEGDPVCPVPATPDPKQYVVSVTDPPTIVHISASAAPTATIFRTDLHQATDQQIQAEVQREVDVSKAPPSPVNALAGIIANIKSDPALLQAFLRALLN